jgi:2',3'-cyclic-nucleotide 2'-phosphodiesterase
LAESKSITVLFIADIVGKSGLDIVTGLLPGLKKSHQVDVCIANGENMDAGNGLTEPLAKQLFSLGVDVITGGNHTWSNAAFRQYLDTSNRVLRPLNYPTEAPGKGVTTVTTAGGVVVGVINAQGRTFLYPIDCPFRRCSEEIDRLRDKTHLIIVDMHAEATAEKIALAWYLDGKVSAIIGTHTHVQTADERILPLGTAYLTDAGMTGPHDSVIGMDVQVAIKRFLKQIPEKYRPANANNRFNGVIIDIDIQSGKAQKIARLNLP